MPRFWNPFQNIIGEILRKQHNPTRAPGLFKRIKDEECQKIASMSLSELFDFIDEVEKQEISMKMDQGLMFLEQKPAAANAYKNAIINILMFIRRRLEGNSIQFEQH